MDLRLASDILDTADGSVGVQSIESTSSSVSSICCSGVGMNEGTPNTGWLVALGGTTGFDERERLEKWSGSEGRGVDRRGAGEDRALELREGVNVGSEGNL